MVDLDEPWAKQADVLALVPRLNQGMLQNWIARDVFGIKEETAQTRGRLRWTSGAILAMRFMMEVRKFGVEPTVSVKLTDDFLQGATDFMQRFPLLSNETSGIEEFVLDGDRLSEYRRFEILADEDGKLFANPFSNDPTSLRLTANATIFHQVSSIMVEQDIMFMTGLNAILRWRAGRDPSTGRLREKQAKS